jgi:hypothetical protein
VKNIEADGYGGEYTVKKKRGKLSLDEIIETMKDYNMGDYLLHLRCYDRDEQPQFCEDAPKGDFVTLYSFDEMKKDLAGEYKIKYDEVCNINLRLKTENDELKNKIKELEAKK